MKMDSEKIAAIIFIAIGVAFGTWAGYRTFKWARKVISCAHFEEETIFEQMYREFEEAFKEHEEAFKSTFGEGFKESYRSNYQKANEYSYNREKAYQEAKKASEGMTVEEACKILGIDRNNLKNLKMEDLKKIFRQQAMKTHPDHGGSNEAFRQTREAYERVAKAA